ncbi:MAG: prepilin-type N-terminal cleavage/methylation domain-containing protein [Ilumatobacter sp.]|nr:prepilin-type N-terminal cleavage/methylation domain-containing protein [Ilumatobacter sp.]
MRTTRQTAVVARQDAGFSLTEMLVTITLMGVAVVAVISGLQATIRSSVIDRDHATAFAWLQAASDEIYRETRVSCTAGHAAAISAYDTAAQNAPVPPVWASLTPAPTVEVIDVEYLGRANPGDDFGWSDAYCFEGGAFASSPLYTQRVTIRVTSHDGKITRTLQTVKSE